MEFENKEFFVEIEYIGFPMSNRCRGGNPAEAEEVEFEVEITSYDKDGKKLKSDEETMCVYITELEIMGDVMRDCDMTQMEEYLVRFGVVEELIKETLEGVVLDAREMMQEDDCQY
jgi:hypothetical protein